MSEKKSNSSSVSVEKNNMSRSSGSSLSKSAADKVMWSLWTMGEDDESQDETDFKLDGKQGNFTFTPPGRQVQDNVSRMFNSCQKSNERQGIMVETSSWSSGMPRKNSETIFNLEY